MTDEKTAIRRDAAKVPTFTRLRDLGRTVSTSDQDIRGLMVKDKNRQDLGKIESLLIDDVGQKVQFLEVASGGFLGLGVRTSFIPVEAITRITADRVFISQTREHVLRAPHYHPGVVATDPAYFFQSVLVLRIRREPGILPAQPELSLGEGPVDLPRRSDTQRPDPRRAGPMGRSFRGRVGATAAFR